MPPLNRPRTNRWPGAKRGAPTMRSAPARFAAFPPRASATAVRAASSRVLTGCRFFPASFAGAAPTKQTTTGFFAFAAAASTFSATTAAGGLEIRTITPVSRSDASAASPASIVSPPTSSLRSRPPVPIACETPAPSRSTSAVTCCRPVPDAATQPIAPRRTRFANASGTPSMIAVPQSGPMTSSFRFAAARFSATSSASATLSLKSMTLRPRASAFSASAAAYSPGTETSARFAPGVAPAAIAIERGGACSAVPPAEGVGAFASSAASTLAIAAFAAASLLARTTTSRSLGRGASPASTSPTSARSAMFPAVAMIAEASSTPATSLSEAESCISATESR